MTLVEIMIVVIVMALIASGVAFAVVPTLVDARVRQTQSDVVVIQQAASVYMIQHSEECPTSIEELNLSSSARQIDAWGTPFTIECDPSTDPRVISSGPDRRVGTDDDISSES
jgi:type II secretory pathway pseudopilin PulG